MDWSWVVIVVIVFIVAAGGRVAVRWRRDQQAVRHSRAEDLERVRRLADEDLTCLAELLERLGQDVEVLHDAAPVDHRTASACRDAARQRLAKVSDAEGVAQVTETLAEGRRALTRLQARVAGLPVPEPRAVCFFDPRHGPSTTDVVWTRGGHGPRTVPACSHDADRVTAGKAPEIRMVERGAGASPYWSAGSAFLPYARGYFAEVAALGWVLQPPTYEAAPADRGDLGAGIVGSSGHFDGGGYDGSGGASGGYAGY
jgi:hypothetical protein